MRREVLMVLLLVVLGTCQGQDTMSVLFIGNSYTYYNNMTQMVYQLAQKAGHELLIRQRTEGGWHWMDVSGGGVWGYFLGLISSISAFSMPNRKRLTTPSTKGCGMWW